MKTQALIILACAASLVGVSEAATIALSRGIGNPGVTASTGIGSTLENGGYYIAVGSYADVPDPTSDLMTLVNDFQVFTSLVSPITGTTKGLITGSFTSTGDGSPEKFNLKAIYFLVGDGATKATSSAFGVFKMADNSAFPPDVTVTGATSVSLPRGDAMVPIAGNVVGNTFVLVPEPSVAFLGALGVLGLVRRRR